MSLQWFFRWQSIGRKERKKETANQWARAKKKKNVLGRGLLTTYLIVLQLCDFSHFWHGNIRSKTVNVDRFNSSAVRSCIASLDRMSQLSYSKYKRCCANSYTSHHNKHKRERERERERKVRRSEETRERKKHKRKKKNQCNVCKGFLWSLSLLTCQEKRIW